MRVLVAAAVLGIAGLLGVNSTAMASAQATQAPDPAQPWNLTQIGALNAWKVTTGAGAKIGIVDTGIDASNPAFAGKIDAQADCVDGPCRAGSADDGVGHGTAVAGIAASVAPGAHFIVARALNDYGLGTTEDIDNAIAWVVAQGAQVVNLSLGDNPEITSIAGSDLASGIEGAWANGAIPVLAAGNHLIGAPGDFSANYGSLDAVVVGASDNAGQVAAYSTPIGNAKWGLVAPGGASEKPGEGVLSPWLGRTSRWLAGTSMATPHVSAALAMLVSQGFAPRAAVQRLLATTNKTIPCGEGCQGHLQLDAAVQPAAAPATTPAAASVPHAVVHAARHAGWPLTAAAGLLLVLACLGVLRERGRVTA